MKIVRLQSLAMLTIAGSLALAGCSGDEDNNNNNTIPDSGVVEDSGVEPDAGEADGGGFPDASTPPPPCPPGTEGCACTSNLGPNDTMFLQDDCEADLLCVPFDLISGRQDLTGPVQSCVKPCSTDADCGSGQTCAPSGYGEETGVGSICMDRIAGFDEFCGYSRGLTSRVPDVTLETSGEIVGCEAGYECFIGTFGDIHPDEGLCLATCEANEDCPASTPYCNPGVFTGTSSTGEQISIGNCSTGKFTAGSICGSGDPDKVGFSSGCDNSADTPDNTFCVPIGGLTPDGYGICMTICDNGAQYGPCTGSEPDGTPQFCSGGFFTSGAGVCTSGCTNYPDACSGDGEFGNGRFCMSYLADDEMNPVGICMDRRDPILVPSTFDADANPVSQGDNCFGQGGSLAFTQCPNPGHCEIIDFQQGVGLCVFGCGETGTATSAAYCDTALGTTGTATCAQAFTAGGQPVTDQGLCGDSAL